MQDERDKRRQHERQDERQDERQEKMKEQKKIKRSREHQDEMCCVCAFMVLTFLFFLFKITRPSNKFRIFEITMTIPESIFSR